MQNGDDHFVACLVKIGSLSLGTVNRIDIPDKGDAVMHYLD